MATKDEIEVDWDTTPEEDEEMDMDTTPEDDEEIHVDTTPGVNITREYDPDYFSWDEIRRIQMGEPIPEELTASGGCVPDNYDPDFDYQIELPDYPTEWILMSFLDWTIPAIDKYGIYRLGFNYDTRYMLLKMIVHFNYEHLKPRYKYGKRWPDWIPRTEATPYRTYPWLPSYLRMRSYKQLLFKDYQSYNWLLNMGERKLLKSFDEWTGMQDEDPDDINMFIRHFDNDGLYHAYGKFWGHAEYIPRLSRFIHWQLKIEQAEFYKWSGKHLGYSSKNYQIVFDSTLQHPSSRIAYSGCRLVPGLERTDRRRWYCKNFKKITGLLHMVQFSAMKNHSVIICEPTALGIMMKHRVQYFYYLHMCCVWLGMFSTVLCLTGNKIMKRWPSVYLLPFAITRFAQYIIYFENRKDPCANYGFWTTWTNNPWEQLLCFQLIRTNPKFLREEKMCFMQRENYGWRNMFSKFFLRVSHWTVLKEMFSRLKNTRSLTEQASRIITRYSCSGVEPQHYFGPMYDFCPYTTGVNIVFRTLMYLGLATFIYYTGSYHIRKYFFLIDAQRRSRSMIYNIHLRAMQGERRYVRMAQPLYQTFKIKYPRDGMEKIDRYIMAKKFGRNMGSPQYYY